MCVCGVCEWCVCMYVCVCVVCVWCGVCVHVCVHARLCVWGGIFLFLIVAIYFMLSTLSYTLGTHLHPVMFRLNYKYV